MLTTSQPEDLIEIIQQGGVIAYPTEAVFGLGCLPNNEASIQRLLALKKRSVDKGLILIASDIEQLSPYIQPLDKEQIAQAQSKQPHPITWLVPAKPGISPLLTGIYRTIAIRLIQHPPIQLLCQQLNQPLVSTSANISGQPATLTTKQVKQQFSEKIDGILDTHTGGLIKPSTIIDLQTQKIIRA